MSRKGIKAKQRKRITYDIRYTDNPADVNRDIAKFINVVMLDGKKSVAERIVFSAFEIISAKTKDDPVKVFEKAVANVRPRLEVRARCRAAGDVPAVEEGVPLLRSARLLPLDQPVDQGPRLRVVRPGVRAREGVPLRREK